MEYDRSVAVEQHPVLSMPVHGSCERKALGVAETGSSQCGSIYLCYRIGNVSTISKPYQGVTVGSVAQTKCQNSLFYRDLRQLEYWNMRLRTRGSAVRIRPGALFIKRVPRAAFGRFIGLGTALGTSWRYTRASPKRARGGGMPDAFDDIYASLRAMMPAAPASTPKPKRGGKFGPGTVRRLSLSRTLRIGPGVSNRKGLFAPHTCGSHRI